MPVTARYRRDSGNRSVIAALQCRGPLTQVALAGATGLTEASISNLVRELVAAGTVDVERTVRQGRPSNLVALSRSMGVVAGVDIGHRHVAVAVADFARHILGERRIELDSELPREKTMDLATGLLDDVLDDVEVPADELTALAMGVPGPLLNREREVVEGTILADWVGFQPAQFLKSRYPGRAIVVDNDANLGALGEQQWGAGRGVDDLIYLKLSTGVGSGLVLHGEIYRGWKGTAGEIGHLQVSQYGQRCSCGHSGCLETVLGLSHLLRRLAPSGGIAPSLAEVASLALAGDSATLTELTVAGQALGDVLAVLTTTLSPRLVVVGGSALDLGDTILTAARDRARERVLPALIDDVQLVPGELRARAEILGSLSAALLAAKPVHLR